MLLLFTAKICLLICFLITIRSTLPRFAFSKVKKRVWKNWIYWLLLLFGFCYGNLTFLNWYNPKWFYIFLGGEFIMPTYEQMHALYGDSPFDIKPGEEIWQFKFPVPGEEHN